jgi:hypothetical protein
MATNELGSPMMRIVRFAACFFLLLLCVLVPLSARTRKLTVMGMLTEAAATGEESTGWTIDLNPVILLDGKQISSIEIKSTNTHRLESLKDQAVEATGNLTYESGAESGKRPVFEVSSIKLRKRNKIYIF